jgi:hypothetical protein
MTPADELRRQADIAGRTANPSHSLREEVTARRRQKALIALAETEDWLNGTPASGAQEKSPHVGHGRAGTAR